MTAPRATALPTGRAAGRRVAQGVDVGLHLGCEDLDAVHGGGAEQVSTLRRLTLYVLDELLALFAERLGGGGPPTTSSPGARAEVLGHARQVVQAPVDGSGRPAVTA